MSYIRMLDAMDDDDWCLTEPPGPKPERFCQADQPPKYRETHEAHTWWLPSFIGTKVFGPQVQRTMEVTWYQCTGLEETP